MHIEPNPTMKAFLLFTSVIAAISLQAAPPVTNGGSGAATAQADNEAADARLRSLVVLHSLKPVVYYAPNMTNSMQFSVITRGRVRVAVQIDSGGRPVDLTLVAYSNRDLADAMMRVLKDWRFEPVKIEGHAISAQDEFDIDFKGPDVVTITTAMDQLEMAFQTMGSSRIEYRPCPLDELDRIPLPLNVVKPNYSVAAREQGVHGAVEVQFYINEAGEVRMPAVVNADRVDIAVEALDAVRQWKFEPPTRKGRPVMITAMQRFDFDKETAALEKK